jgi:hypothetical protein
MATLHPANARRSLLVPPQRVRPCYPPPPFVAGRPGWTGRCGQSDLPQFQAVSGSRRTGGIIGDGQLPEAGPEQIIETYYSFAAFSFAKVTGDYQFVNNPACNRQRGPVSVFALHLHVEY